MDRRRFLATSAAAAVAGSLGGAGRGTARSPGVSDEFGKLKRVVVHTPGAEVFKSFPMFPGDHSMFTWELLRHGAVTQHAAFVELLKKRGVEVLDLRELLADAIGRARQSNQLLPWLAEAAPSLAEHADGVTAETLLGADDAWVYRRDASGAMEPLLSPATTLFFTRDVATMTPRGVVIGNFHNRVRAFEAELARFAFRHASALQEYPVVFDAREQGVRLQGGDIMVLDPNTLLVGIGNVTEPAAAVRLAQQLNMDVIAVQMPSAEWHPGEWMGLQTIFYHLDCLINLVAPGKALAVPYLLEKQYSAKNPLLDALYGLARTAGAPRNERIAMLDEVRNVGWIVRFKAGSGERDELVAGLKLADYLVDSGFSIVPAGGLPDAGMNELKYVVERVVRECRFMSVNVLALAPGEVLAFDGNPHSVAALERSGIQVSTFASHELVRANGGPRCLTMPLERELDP